ncbi:MAG: nucleotidyl transferase AbiEii/AbiGii toxin family protein [Coriobacteriales bacterium]|jgi:hypothetical protein|nr:nucleotidyl transferase AbiEii/AbiGii toxin family protein [Coriobacteriales bacterium]
MTQAEPTDIIQGLDSLKPKAKEPISASVLSKWISQAESSMGVEQAGRLSWLIATTVVSAMLQQVVDENANSRFLLKGGTMLQYRLGSVARATKDLDGIIRGDIESFLRDMDKQMKDGWGPISFSCGEVEVINTPARIIKPRRFDTTLSLHGRIWRRITVEISPDEGESGVLSEIIPSPTLAPFGLPTPDTLATLAMSYQIAQKIHAATDPHDPPEFVNERARDVVDLILLKNLAEFTAAPSDVAIYSAVKDIFNFRAKESEVLGRPQRAWPARLTAFPHWRNDYVAAAESAGVELSLEEAILELNEWFGSIG